MFTRLRAFEVLGAIALAGVVACGPTPPPNTPGVRSTAGSKDATAAGSPTPGAPGTPGRPETPGVAPATASPTQAPAAVPGLVTTLAPAPSGAPAVATVLAGMISAPANLVLAAGGLISDKGIGIIANNGGGIIANNGSGLVSNNGSNVLANNGAGLVSKTKYTLAQALAQVPLQGVVVTLVDGAGNAVVGPDGKPVAAVTDEAGRYSFVGARPDIHLVARAELPGVGALTRIVAPAVADAPLDLASTLATTYILDRYVGTQTDKLATLARLPADVEAETVLIAGQAAAQDVPLATLTSAAVVARVDALRSKNATFDAQLEKVKKLLIVAGASNLGAGEIATQVPIASIKAIWPRPDGQIYLHASADQVIWRLDPDGRLRAVAGRAAEGPGAGIDVGQAELVLDRAGRLLGGGLQKGVWRLTPGATPADSKVEKLAPDLAAVTAVCPLEGDAVMAFAQAPDGATVAWRLEPGAAPKQLVGDAGALAKLIGIVRAVRMPSGAIRLQTWTFTGMAVYELDAATGVISDLRARVDVGPFDSIRLDSEGTLYYAAVGTGEVRAAKGDAVATVPELKPADLTGVSALAPAPGGGLYIARNQSDANVQAKNATLHLVKDGVSKHLAGLPAASAPEVPGVVALAKPTAFAVEANGDLLVVDNAVLVRVTPGGAPSPAIQGDLAAEGATFRAWEPFPLADGSCMLAAINNQVGSEPSRHAIFRVSASGQATLVRRLEGGFRNVARGADGSALLTAVRDDLSLGEVLRIAPDGTITQLVEPAKEAVAAQVWFDAGRPVYGKSGGGFLTVSYTPVRFEAGGTTTTLPSTSVVPHFTDALGRTYAIGATVTRMDPKTGETVVLAGPGGRTFAGTGVDDAVGEARQTYFGPLGDLFFLDGKNKQIKRIPANKL